MRMHSERSALCVGGQLTRKCSRVYLISSLSHCGRCLAYHKGLSSNIAGAKLFIPEKIPQKQSACKNAAFNLECTFIQGATLTVVAEADACTRRCQPSSALFEPRHAKLAKANTEHAA
eukprot:6198118-Pleurochrysis_carterae.AAC.5